MNVRPTVRTFAPEQWGEAGRFIRFYEKTFEFSPFVKRVVAGVEHHFGKALILKRLADRIKPNMILDIEQLKSMGFTEAVYSQEYTAIIEGIMLELYSTIDCTVKIIYEIHRNKCRGLKDSTQKTFAGISKNEIGDDFPHELRRAFEEATWYGKLLTVRNKLTHADVGVCQLDMNGYTASYMHRGIMMDGKPLHIEDVDVMIDEFVVGVRKFTDRVFRYLNSILTQEPLFQVCGVFFGKCYTRHVVPSVDITDHSGVCDSHVWFDLPENPRCPLADACGAYAAVKVKTTSEV